MPQGVEHRLKRRSQASLDEYDRFDFGRRLRDVRMQRALSQMDLALEVGGLPGWISELETGRRQPTVETVMRLCRTLGIPPGALLVLPPLERPVEEPPPEPPLANARQLPPIPAPLMPSFPRPPLGVVGPRNKPV